MSNLTLEILDDSLTDNERKILDEIAEHDFGDALNGDGIPVCELNEINGYALGGVLSSLVKKGIITWEGDANRGDVYLTPAGIDLAS